MAAISVGYLAGAPALDLVYLEDSRAEVDLNLVATQSGAIVEVREADGSTYVDVATPTESSGTAAA